MSTIYLCMLSGVAVVLCGTLYEAIAARSRGPRWGGAVER